MGTGVTCRQESLSSEGFGFPSGFHFPWTRASQAVEFVPGWVWQAIADTQCPQPEGPVVTKTAPGPSRSTREAHPAPESPQVSMGPPPQAGSLPCAKDTPLSSGRSELYAPFIHPPFLSFRRFLAKRSAWGGPLHLLWLGDPTMKPLLHNLPFSPDRTLPLPGLLRGSGRCVVS